MVIRRLVILFFTVGLPLAATLVPQKVVNNYQRLTRNIVINETDSIIYGSISGSISTKYRSSDEDWVTITIDPTWHNIVYTHSYMENNERKADSITGYQGSGEGSVRRPMGICYDTRYDGFTTRQYFFVSMPDSHTIKRYYYNEQDGNIYYSSAISTSNDNPEAIHFCEDGSGYYWLVYTDIGQKKVVIYQGANKLEYSASEFGGLDHPRAIAVKRVPTIQYEYADVYIADTYNHRVIKLRVVSAPPQYGGYKISSSKAYSFSYDVYPSAIGHISHPGNIDADALYVIDAMSGDIFVLNSDLDYVIKRYESDPVIEQARHLSFMEGEAGVTEFWASNSGIQYFWIDCEVTDLYISPPVVAQGAHPWARFRLTGIGDSVIVTIKNAQGSTCATQIWNDKGANIYNWGLTEVRTLSPGTYTVIVKAIDPYGESDESDENYTLHSADTAQFEIKPAYTTHSFELYESEPDTNSFLWNNCCSNVIGQRVAGTGTNPAHSGFYMFKFSATDTNSVADYNCVDCRVFSNCGIAITKPTYLSCWIKATKAPGEEDSLYVSLDGIIKDANYTWQQLKLWTKYGKCIDQYGQWIHGGYHPVPVDSQWHHYVFSLTPATGDTIYILQFSYWGVPIENTGDFEAYLDDISISADAHPWNMWYGETFGNGSGSGHTNGDPNFELGLSLKDEWDRPLMGGARIMVDGHGDSGEGSLWITPTPSIRKDLHPFQNLDTSSRVSWMQYDKAHSLILGFIIDGNPLYYAWNGMNHWDEQGYVAMGDAGHSLDTNEWMVFNRNIYQDYYDEYAAIPQEVQAYQILHYCKSDLDGDNGGTIKGPVFLGGPITPTDPSNIPTVVRPNGGEKWVGGKIHVYGHKVGEDLPKYIAVYWTDEFYTLQGTGDWELVDVREFNPGWNEGQPQVLALSLEDKETSPGDIAYGPWQSPTTLSDKPNCGFKTVAINSNGFPLAGQADYSDGLFTLLGLMVDDPDWPDICSVPQIPGTHPEVGWQTDGINGVEGVDIYYTTQGGLSQEELLNSVMLEGGDSIWHTMVTGLAPGTYQATDSFYDPVGDSLMYEYAYVGSYTGWTVPNIPTSGGNFKFVAYDSTGDTALFIMPETFNIPFGGAVAYSTAQTADKIGSDENNTFIVYADDSGNVVASSNPDGYEWDELETLGQGEFPSLTLDDAGNPTAVWVTGPENQENIAFCRYQSGSWGAPLMVALAESTGVTRYSESSLRNWKTDTLRLASFRATGILDVQGPDFREIGLIRTGFHGGSPEMQVKDTVWGQTGTNLTPIVSAPAYVIDAGDDEHYAFNWLDTTIYIQVIAGVNHYTEICASPVVWPCLSVTEGNIYLTIGKVVADDTCLIQLWKHPQDTFWRGQDTLYKGSLAYTQSIGGAANLIQSSSRTLTRLSFDPIERETDTVHVADSTYFSHGAVCYRTLEDGLPLIWTQRSGSAYYVATDWHDPDETIFPSYYIDAGHEMTPYTQHRDSTVTYSNNVTVDWAEDSLVYTLTDLDQACNHTLLVEFYFRDDSLYERSYLVSAAAQTDTVEVFSHNLTRAAIALPAGDTTITVKITADTGSVELARLLLYNGEEGGAQTLMSSKNTPRKQAIPYVLYQNFPNPFTSTTRIMYGLPYNRHVSLKVYDVAGRQVTSLVDEDKSPGIYEVIWDGRDNLSRKLSSGVYFIRFSTDDFEQTRKAVFVK